MSAVSFTIEGIGKVEMIGTGPWTTTIVGTSYEVRDSEGKVANPTVHQRFSGTALKPNRNVIFAKPSRTLAIVEQANKLFSAPAAPASKTQVDG